MAFHVIDQCWHRLLRRPYQLAVVRQQGEGQPVILLHGIGRSARIWQHLFEQLAFKPLSVSAFDLLGFGASPKPAWPQYNVDDHARAVLASIKRLQPSQPVILVGHSMGCLVAVRVARLRPDLVKHLVLYEMPLYEGLPEKRRYRLRLNVYYRFYEWVLKQNPTFDETERRFRERLASKVAGSELTPETWQPFVKSLRNTIMRQSAADDIKHLTMAADVVYGSRDMLVIRGKVQTIFGKDASNITAHTIRERHVISVKAAKFLAGRILAAAEVPDAG
jgi:pimeloyl-ACP methyl ester carboxylesterase